MIPTLADLIDLIVADVPKLDLDPGQQAEVDQFEAGFVDLVLSAGLDPTDVEQLRAMVFTLLLAIGQENEGEERVIDLTESPLFGVSWVISSRLHQLLYGKDTQ